MAGDKWFQGAHAMPWMHVKELSTTDKACRWCWQQQHPQHVRRVQHQHIQLHVSCKQWHLTASGVPA
jgi:hypothetical protein